MLGQLSHWVAMHEGDENAYETFTRAAQNLLLEDFTVIFYATTMVSKVVSEYILPVAIG